MHVVHFTGSCCHVTAISQRLSRQHGKNDSIVCWLQQPAATFRGATVAEKNLAGYTPHLVVVVPGEFHTCSDVPVMTGVSVWQ